MSRKNTVGLQTINNKSFDDYRNFLLEDFSHNWLFYKRRFSQGAYWTNIEKDLANQYFRDERWFCGIKFVDNIKLIDHGVEDIKNTGGIGFAKK